MEFSFNNDFLFMLIYKWGHAYIHMHAHAYIPLHSWTRDTNSQADDHLKKKISVSLQPCYPEQVYSHATLDKPDPV